MTQIISFIKGIFDFLSTAWGFFMQFIDSLNAIIHNIPSVISFLTGGIMALPSIVTAFATLTLLITVAYFLLNRATGGSD